LAASTSITRVAAPAITPASGCAPPMPPQPPVSSQRPASVPPKCLRAQAMKVS
jgi:hypothetical protein